ncbi:uncharacterized [Tachysurus ichikawai]
MVSNSEHDRYIRHKKDRTGRYGKPQDVTTTLQNSEAIVTTFLKYYRSGYQQNFGTSVSTFLGSIFIHYRHPEQAHLPLYTKRCKMIRELTEYKHRAL